MIGPSDGLAWFLYRLFGPIVGSAGRQTLATVLVLPESLRGEGRRNDLTQAEAMPLEPPSGIHIPTLIIHGTADRIVPFAHAEAAHQAIPNSKLVSVPRGGHGILFSRAGDLKPAVAEFLERLAHRPSPEL